MNFTSENFTRNDLSEKVYNHSEFKDCYFIQIVTENITFTGCKFIDCSFPDLNLKNIKFDSCDFKNCTFNDVIFDTCKMIQCNFSKCDIHIKFNCCNIRANFNNCYVNLSLKDTILSGKYRSARIRIGADNSILDDFDASGCTATLNGYDFKIINSLFDGVQFVHGKISGAKIHKDVLFSNCSFLNFYINDKRVISLSGLNWHVLILADYTRIGCQVHDNDFWLKLMPTDVDVLNEMSGLAVEFWTKYGDAIKAMIKE